MRSSAELRSDDQGFRNAANNQWSVDQDNRSMTSDSLQHSILFGAAKQSKRANLKKWVDPDANGERGEWSLGHTNPAKVSPRDIATWEDTMLLTVVDSGPYEQKTVPGCYFSAENAASAGFPSMFSHLHQ
jgi:hypothetical protein